MYPKDNIFALPASHLFYLKNILLLKIIDKFIPFRISIFLLYPLHQFLFQTGIICCKELKPAQDSLNKKGVLFKGGINRIRSTGTVTRITASERTRFVLSSSFRQNSILQAFAHRLACFTPPDFKLDLLFHLALHSSLIPYLSVPLIKFKK